MRHYLYGQARSELSGAVPDLGELPALTSFGHTLTGQYDIAWLPTRGKPLVILIPLSTDQEAFTNAPLGPLPNRASIPCPSQAR
jgi:hypothetical protein